jgi:hypothetical protein
MMTPSVPPLSPHFGAPGTDHKTTQPSVWKQAIEGTLDIDFCSAVQNISNQIVSPKGKAESKQKLNTGD